MRHISIPLEEFESLAPALFSKYRPGRGDTIRIPLRKIVDPQEASRRYVELLLAGHRAGQAKQILGREVDRAPTSLGRIIYPLGEKYREAIKRVRQKGRNGLGSAA